MTEFSKDDFQVFIELLKKGINSKDSNKKSTHKQRPYTKKKSDDSLINRLMSLIGEYEYQKSHRNRFPEKRIHSGGWFVSYDCNDPLCKTGQFFLVGTEAIDAYKGYFDHIKSYYQGNMFYCKYTGEKEFKEHSDHSIMEEVFECWDIRTGECHQNLKPIFANLSKWNNSKTSWTLSSETEEHLESQFKKFSEYGEALFETYIERLIIDQLWYGYYSRGNITDVDYVVYKNKHEQHYVDVKRKYPAYDGSLGINDEHLMFFRKLQKLSGRRVIYISVTHTKNSDDTVAIIASSMDQFFESERLTMGRSGLMFGAKVPCRNVHVTSFRILDRTISSDTDEAVFRKLSPKFRKFCDCKEFKQCNCGWYDDFH